MVVKYDTDDITHENVCIWHIHNIVQCLNHLYLRLYESYYGKASTFLKEIKLETQTVFLAHQTFGFFMKNDAGIY